MQKEEIEVYSRETNSGIVRMPERCFPGVVIQGDSLCIMFHDLMSALEGAEGKVDDDTFLAILEQAEAVEHHLLHYEATLKKNGIELPYVRDSERSTAEYTHYRENR